MSKYNCVMGERARRKKVCRRGRNIFFSHSFLSGCVCLCVCICLMDIRKFRYLIQARSIPLLTNFA